MAMAFLTSKFDSKLMHTADGKIRFSKLSWRVSWAFSAFWFLALVSAVSAQTVPALINYQGQISNPDGTPMATADYELSFSIFDAAQGGTLIWGPQKFNGTSGPGFGPKVPVVQGYFNVMLGPVDTANQPITASFTSPTRYLEVQVGANNPIAPRQQLLSAPYAVRADQSANSSKLQGYDWSAILAPGSLDPQTGFLDGSKIATNSIDISKLAQSIIDSVVPAGTIVAFGGEESSVPRGWLLCDGRRLYSTNYPRLFASISTNWGNGSISPQLSAVNLLVPRGDFNIPDLRGVFLRGVNGNRVPNDTGFSTFDPDVSARVSSALGGAIGNHVGSMQSDAFKLHKHIVALSLDSSTINGNLSQPAAAGPFTASFSDKGIYGTHNPNSGTYAAGGSETRPVNVYVNYIIKE